MKTDLSNPSPRSQTIYGSLVDTFGPYFQRYTSGFLTVISFCRKSIVSYFI